MERKSTIALFVILVLAVIFFLSYTQKPVNYTDRDELTKAVTDLHACSQDSNCVITYGYCNVNIIAINTKYKTSWESTPPSNVEEERCAVLGAPVCAYHGMGYNCTIDEYVAKCVNGLCEAKHKAELA